MRRHIAQLVTNYIRRLADKEAIWLYNRLHDRLGNDVAEALRFMSKSPDMDRWFATSRSANELYDMVDMVARFVKQDNRNKAMSLS